MRYHGLDTLLGTSVSSRERAPMSPDEPKPPTDPDETEAASTPRHARERIGPYMILGTLGVGGMGIVYVAEQTEPIRRRVALKVIKHGMDSAQVIARFEAERQALALMDHPAIAKIYDAGATPDGRPYFAMEYVKGVPITEHCDREKLTNRERLELFIQVCEGVQHAHQKAVIHRDLKPSNVLVSVENGRSAVKIIDFGVAKALAQRLTERTLYTELGVMIGTPEYMSPEQAEMTGQDVDTRSDVYSLGVLLYQLLVGALPFDAKELRQAGFDEIRRKIREEEPPRPSARLSTLGDRSTESARRRRTDLPALRRELAGELDWITMRALEKDRARRYASPAELASDIGRQLRDEPVLARAPSTFYRVSKYVHRHGAAVTVTLVVLVVLGAGVMTTLWQARIGLRDWGSALQRGADRTTMDAQRKALLLPQFALYGCVTLALLAGVAYFSRATSRRLVGALAGGTTFMLVFVAQSSLADSMGWWRYAFTEMPVVPSLMFVSALVCYGAILGLLSWRVTRRFGWRGQLAVIGVMSVMGPIRDHLGAALTELIVIRPGAAPVMAWAILWACNVALLQGVMRLVAGAAAADRLARLSEPRYPAL